MKKRMRCRFVFVVKSTDTNKLNKLKYKPYAQNTHVLCCLYYVNVDFLHAFFHIPELIPVLNTILYAYCPCKQGKRVSSFTYIIIIEWD